MDAKVKQRLVGAVVVAALIFIVLAALLRNNKATTDDEDQISPKTPALAAIQPVTNDNPNQPVVPPRSNANQTTIAANNAQQIQSQATVNGGTPVPNDNFNNGINPAPAQNNVQTVAASAVANNAKPALNDNNNLTDDSSQGITQNNAQAQQNQSQVNNQTVAANQNLNNNNGQQNQAPGANNNPEPGEIQNVNDSENIDNTNKPSPTAAAAIANNNALTDDQSAASPGSPQNSSATATPPAVNTYNVTPVNNSAATNNSSAAANPSQQINSATANNNIPVVNHNKSRTRLLNYKITKAPSAVVVKINSHNNYNNKDIFPTASNSATIAPLTKKGNAWAVQVGVFKNAANAAIMVKDLKTKQYNAYAVAVNTQHGLRTHVLVGPRIQNHAAAQALAAKLQQKNNIQAILVPALTSSSAQVKHVKTQQIQLVAKKSFPNSQDNLTNV